MELDLVDFDIQKLIESHEPGKTKKADDDESVVNEVIGVVCVDEGVEHGGCKGVLLACAFKVGQPDGSVVGELGEWMVGGGSMALADVPQRILYIASVILPLVPRDVSKKLKYTAMSNGVAGAGEMPKVLQKLVHFSHAR